MYNPIRLFLASLVLLATAATAVAQTAPTWTFTPTLKRLDASDNVLTGEVQVRDRSENIRIGVYMQVSGSLASTVTVLGLENLQGVIHFTPSGLSASDVESILDDVGTGESAAGMAGWNTRLMTSDSTFFSFSFATGSLVTTPPAFIQAQPANGRAVIGPLSDITEPVPASPRTRRGAWCTPSSGSCEIFLGVITMPLTDMPAASGGSLSVKFAGNMLSDSVTVLSMRALATPSVQEGNTINYYICPSSGCPVTANFASNAYSVDEGDTVDLRVNLSQAYGSSITIPIAARTTGMGAGTAPTTAYTLPSPASVTFAANTTTQTFRVTADDNADDAADAAEMQTLVLDFGTLPSTVVGGGTTSATVTINDDDYPDATVVFGAADYAATEGGGTAEVTVTVTAPAAPGSLEREVVIPITTTLAGGASNADFSGVAATLTFPAVAAGTTSRTFTVTATDDTAMDTGESITLGFGALPRDMAAGSQSTTSVALRDDDSDLVRLSVPSTTLGEADGATNVTVTGTLEFYSMTALTAAIEVPLGVSGTATTVSGGDYTITLDTLTFASGATSGQSVDVTVAVDPNEDMVVENVETIVITGTPAGFLTSVVDATPVINLSDNDTATVSIARVGSSDFSEGADGAGPDGTGQADTATAEFTATLSAQVATAVTVSWSATVDGDTGTEDADPAADLVATSRSGSVVFPADSAAGTALSVSVSIENDALSEIDEVFRVALGTIDGAPARTGVETVTVHGANGFADATIDENDPLVVALEAPPKLLEGRDAVYTLRVLDGISTQDIEATVTVAVANTAVTQAAVPDNTGCTTKTVDICQTDGSDYPTPPAGTTVTIDAGEATGTFRLRIADDGRGDENEEVTVAVSSVQGGRGAASNTGGISVAPASPAQPGGPVGQAVRPISEALAVSLGPVAEDEREKAEGGTFTIPVIVDDKLEGDDTLTVEYAVTAGAEPLPVYERAGAEDYRDENDGSITLNRAEHCGEDVEGCRASITVTAVDDELSEAAESFTVMLTAVRVNSDSASPRQALVADDADTATLTIAENDPLMVTLEAPTRLREGREETLTLGVTGGTSTAPIVLDVHVCFPSCAPDEAGSLVAAASAGSSAPAPAANGGSDADAILVDGDLELPIPMGGLVHRTTIPAGASQKNLIIRVVRDEDEDEDDEMLGFWYTNLVGGRGPDLEGAFGRRYDDAPAYLADEDRMAGGVRFVVIGNRLYNVADLEVVPGLDDSNLPSAVGQVGATFDPESDIPQSIEAAAEKALQIKQVFLVSINTDREDATLAVDEGGEFRIPVEVDDELDEGVTLTVTYTVSPDTGSPGAEAPDVSDAADGSVGITGPGATPGTLIRIGAVDDNRSEAMETFTVTLTGVTSSNADLVAAELDPAEGSTTTSVQIGPSDPITVSFIGPAEEREGSTATYTVSLDGGVSTAEVIVPIVLDPSAMAAPGRDNRPAADEKDVEGLTETLDGKPGRTVTLAAGATSQTFDLPVVRESGAGREGEEFLVLELGSELTGGGGGGLMPDPDARSVGTVITEVNLEERGKAMKYTLAAFGRTVASGVVEAIEGRIAASRSSGGSRATFAGEEVSLNAFRLSEGEGGEEGDAEAAAKTEETLRKIVRLLGVSPDGEEGASMDPVSSQEILTGSSFDLSMRGERGSAGSWSLWGRGSAARFEGTPEIRFSMKGDVLSGHVGFDGRPRDDMLAGIALNHSKGDTDYRFIEGTKGTIETTLTSVHPYLHWSPEQKIGLWATVGFGHGDATLDDGDSEPVETDVQMRMGAAGTRVELDRWQNIDWAMKADAFIVQLESAEVEDLLPAVEADALRIRMIVEGSKSVQLADGAALTGILEFGARVDGGDADDGAGMEVGGGMTYGHPELGLDLGVRGRAVVAHRAWGFKEWGMSFSATYDPGAPGRGLHMSVEPAWGNAASGVNALWKSSTSADASESNSDEARRPDPDMALAAEAGYGLGLMNDRGLLTPFGALNLSNEQSGVRLGTRLTLEARRDTDLELELYGERESGGIDDDAAVRRSMVLGSRVSRGLWRGTGAVEVFSKLSVGDKEDYEVGARVRLRF